MFRLVYFADAKPEEEDEAHLISAAVSKTIVNAIDRNFGITKEPPVLSEDAFQLFMIACFGSSFFRGIGGYLGVSDEQAGNEIVYRKILRMREKMLDKKKYYTFDLLEELIFAFLIDKDYAIIEDVKDEGGKKRLKATLESLYDLEGEKKAAAQLQEKYGYSAKKAEKRARCMYRLYKMRLKDDEDDNLFFWDDDYDSFWRGGFVDGLMQTKGFWGEMRGYGYAYTCDIFEDIGIAAPLRLLGTMEANRILNEKSRDMYFEQMNRMAEYLVKSNGDAGDILGNFPFDIDE